MRKRVYGRKLSRDTNERKALLRSLAVAFFTHDKIDTTEAKAKAVRPWLEKLVTRAKTNDLNSRRILMSEVPSPVVVERLLSAIGPTFSERPGGYTRLTRLGPRSSDNAPIVRLEFVEVIKSVKKTVTTKKESARKESAKKPVKATKKAPVKRVTRARKTK